MALDARSCQILALHVQPKTARTIASAGSNCSNIHRGCRVVAELLSW
jgi:hypothetical protein